MQIHYKNGVYSIYLTKARTNPKDEIHIHSSNIGIVKRAFVKYVSENKIFAGYYIRKFDKLMIECVKEQLKEV